MIHLLSSNIPRKSNEKLLYNFPFMLNKANSFHHPAMRPVSGL